LFTGDFDYLFMFCTELFFPLYEVEGSLNENYMLLRVVAIFVLLFPDFRAQKFMLTYVD